MNIEGLANMVSEEGEELLIELVDRICKLRALRDDESILTEKLIRKANRRRGKRTTHRWTKDDDRSLLRVQNRPRGVAQFAEKIGVTEMAAWVRLDRLRKRLRGASSSNQVEG